MSRALLLAASMAIIRAFCSAQKDSTRVPNTAPFTYPLGQVAEHLGLTEGRR